MKPHKTWIGLGFSILCLIGWCLSLVILVNSNRLGFNKMETIGAIVLRTFLQTGLFILAHDAIHQNLCPNNLRLNHSLGFLALWCYGGLDYNQCRQNHYYHHYHPGSPEDQDLRGKNATILRWYFSFITNYLSLQQFLKILFNLSLFLMTGGFTALHLSQRLFNLFLFYFLPLIFSSWQLFIFGTYLPHRPIPGESFLSHHSRSLNHPEWLSLCLCFHFGYHWEHHEYPYLPWYGLPTVRKAIRQGNL